MIAAAIATDFDVVLWPSRWLIVVGSASPLPGRHTNTAQPNDQVVVIVGGHECAGHIVRVELRGALRVEYEDMRYDLICERTFERKWLRPMEGDE